MESLADYENFNPDRDDDSFRDEDLSKEPNRLLRLKKYIIRLRRYGDVSIFQEFKFFVESNQDFFLNILKPRQLMSLIDTYIDFGDDLEKTIGIGIANYVFHEKLYLTTFCIFDTFPKSKIEKDRQVSSSGVHSIHSVRLSYDDAPIVFLNRISKVYSTHPFLSKVWITLINIFLKEPKSSMFLLFNNMSEKMKEDYSQLMNDLLLDGKLSESSLLKLEEIKKYSFNYGK